MVRDGFQCIWQGSSIGFASILHGFSMASASHIQSFWKGLGCVCSGCGKVSAMIRLHFAWISEEFGQAVSITLKGGCMRYPWIWQRTINVFGIILNGCAIHLASFSQSFWKDAELLYRLIIYGRWWQRNQMIPPRPFCKSLSCLVQFELNIVYSSMASDGNEI